MVQEKLKSVYLTAVDDEIMTYTQRIFNLAQLSLSEKLSVVFTGLSNILTANCSYGGIFNTEQADQQRLKIISQIEDFIITTIQPSLSEQPELFDIINQCDLLSFQEKCIQTLIQPTNDYKLLFNMNEQYLEHFISHSNPVYLHEYYTHHGLFKKAAEFAYSLCYPTDNEPEVSIPTYEDLDGQVYIPAYIRDITENSITVDVVEFIDRRNTERINELGLTEYDMVAGYYMVNSSIQTREWKLDEQTTFSIADWKGYFRNGEPGEYVTSDMNEVVEYINKYRLISKGIKIQEKMKHSPITKKTVKKVGIFSKKTVLFLRPIKQKNKRK